MKVFMLPYATGTQSVRPEILYDSEISLLSRCKES